MSTTPRTFLWLMQRRNGHTYHLESAEKPAALANGTRVIGLNVNRMRSLVQAGERRERERLARHAGEAGIALPIVKTAT